MKILDTFYVWCRRCAQWLTALVTVDLIYWSRYFF